MIFMTLNNNSDEIQFYSYKHYARSDTFTEYLWVGILIALDGLTVISDPEDAEISDTISARPKSTFFSSIVENIQSTFMLLSSKSKKYRDIERFLSIYTCIHV